MIAFCTAQGEWLKTLSVGNDYGWHPRFGISSPESAEARERMRRNSGLVTRPVEWLFRFRLDATKKGFEVKAGEGCKVKKNGETWEVDTSQGTFLLLNADDAKKPLLSIEPEETKSRSAIAGTIVLLFLVGGSFLLREPKVEKEKAPETVTVFVEPPAEAVPIPKPQQLEAQTMLQSRVQDTLKSGGAAVAQELGFLKLLGRKDLKKAIGGNPVDVAKKSPGAGPGGGTEGSGGELLVGLGQGVKQTTVGNTGTKGLGGVGKTGMGGGEGGYGDSMIGSGGRGNGLNGVGDGRRLSSAIALSQDITLEGGLDPSIIQATIARHLSEIRACYEGGLRDQPGLSGQVSMAFEISGDGKMNFVKVHRSSLGSARVETCMGDVMKNWLFPKPRGGVNVKVTYPFVLRPVNS